MGDFEKYNRGADIAVLIGKKRQRDEQGKKSTFAVRGKEISAEEVDRYAERIRVQDPAFEELPASAPTPTHITYLSLPSSPATEGAENALVTPDDLSSTLQSERSPVATGKRKRSRSHSAGARNGLVHHLAYRFVRSRESRSYVPIAVTAPDVFQMHELLFTNIA
jgi:hypothetical protein